MCCNKNCTASHFCCGSTLRTGCIIYGCLQLTCSLGWGIAGTLAYFPGFYHEVLTIIPVLQCVLTFINGLMIIVGTYEKNLKVLWTSFYFEIIGILFSFISTFFWPVNSTTSFIVLGMWDVIFSSCLLIFIRSFNCEIKAEKEKDEQKTYNTEEDYYEEYPLEYALRPISLGTYINDKRMPANAPVPPEVRLPTREQIRTEQAGRPKEGDSEIYEEINPLGYCNILNEESHCQVPK